MAKANAKLIAQLNSLKDVSVVVPLSVAQFVAKRARDLAPVDTGFLRDHIHARKHSQLEAVVAAEADYSGFVEYGTRYMAAQPFMRPAVDEGQREIVELAAKEINAEIRRRVGR